MLITSEKKWGEKGFSYPTALVTGLSCKNIGLGRFPATKFLQLPVPDSLRCDLPCWPAAYSLLAISHSVSFRLLNAA